MRRTLTLTLTLLLLSGANPLRASGEETVPDAPPVNVYRQTMSEYVGLADCNVTMKLHMSTYVEALEHECDALRLRIKAKVAPSKDLPSTIDDAHEATKAYARNMGSLSEELNWWDFQTGEMGWGTGYGYIVMSFQADVLWRLIVAYQLLLQGDDGSRFDMVSPLASGEIGGTAPEHMASLLSPPVSKRGSKVRLNFDQLGK